MTTLLRLNTLFLLVLSALFGTVSARPQVNMIEAMHKRAASPTSVAGLLTNSARMAAGLGPFPPRNLFKPTRANVARANPSVITLSGRIKVTRADNGNFVGYVDKTYRTLDGRLPVNTNPNAPGSDLTVSFTQPVSASSLFNIPITSNTNIQYPNLGFAHASNTLQNSFDYTILTGTNPTTAGGVASKVGNAMQDSDPYSESPIWSYDASSGRLSTTWFNPSSPGSSSGVSVAVNTYYSSTSASLLQSGFDMSSLGYVQVFLTLA